MCRRPTVARLLPMLAIPRATPACELHQPPALLLTPTSSLKPGTTAVQPATQASKALSGVTPDSVPGIPVPTFHAAAERSERQTAARLGDHQNGSPS